MADPQNRGAPKAYTVLGKSFHDGRLYRGGEVIMLYDDEVGPQHAAIAPREPEMPQAQPVPAKRKWVRKVKPPVLPEAAPALAPAKAEPPKAEKAAVPVKHGRSPKPRA